MKLERGQEDVKLRQNRGLIEVKGGGGGISSPQQT